MKAYSNYKDSGVSGIEQIPKHWILEKIKFVATCNDEVLSDSTADDEIINYVEIGDVDYVNGITNTTEYEFKEAPSRARRVTRPNDIIISTVRTYLKAIAKIAEPDLIVSTGFAVIRPRKIDEIFMSYALLAPTFIEEVMSRSFGVSYPAIKASSLMNIKICIPPLSEQKAIASFLEAKTKPIDGIIAKREKQIELLEEMKSAIISRAVTKGLNPEAQMKDSGIEWIGEIPEGWDVIKTSFLFQLIGSGTTPSKNAPNYAEEGLYWLQTGDFNDNYVNDTSKYITDLAVQNCSALTLFPKGCLVIAMYGASIGKLGILNIESYTNQACCVLGREKNILIKFAFYAYKAGRKALINESRGGGQPNISQDIISHFKIPVPPINEQCNVIAYLDSETSKIDTRITKRRKQIELLQEYKQALITAAVTGKIDVR